MSNTLAIKPRIKHTFQTTHDLDVFLNKLEDYEVADAAVWQQLLDKPTEVTIRFNTSSEMTRAKSYLP